MGSDVGAWKLIIYPMVIFLIIGLVLNLTIQPFVDNGVNIDSGNLTTLESMADLINQTTIHTPEINVFGITIFGGNNVTFIPYDPFNVLGNDIHSFVNNQVQLYHLIPDWLQFPLLIIGLICLGLAIYELLAMLIPG